VSGSNYFEIHPRAASPVSNRLVAMTVSNPNLVKFRCINYLDRKILKNYRISKSWSAQVA